MGTKDPIQILIVEDHPSYVHLIRGMLRQAMPVPYQDCSAGRLEEVMELLGRQTFDVVLLDLSLPDSSGLATLEKVLLAAQGVPIIVLTGFDDEAVGRAAVHAGAEDFLVKDRTDAAGLCRCVHYAIERNRRKIVERERDVLQLAVCGMEQALGVVSHDLRVPLSAIRNTTELLRRGLVDEESKRNGFLDAMHRESLRMGDMLDNLLDAARLNSGRARWRWSVVSLAGVLKEAIGTVSSIVGSISAEVTSTAHPADLTMRGDRDGIRRLAINLLTNAVKNTPRGSIAIVASDAGTDDAGNRWVEIAFRDTGYGMAPEVVAQLGRPFALNAGPVGSSAGLGVAICRGIARAHGGTIVAQSEPGQGTLVIARMRADLDAPASDDMLDEP